MGQAVSLRNWKGVVIIFKHYWLVVWNMAFMTFHILGIIIPTDELIFFRGVETTNQIWTVTCTIIADFRRSGSSLHVNSSTIWTTDNSRRPGLAERKGISLGASVSVAWKLAFNLMAPENGVYIWLYRCIMYTIHTQTQYIYIYTHVIIYVYVYRQWTADFYFPSPSLSLALYPSLSWHNMTYCINAHTLWYIYIYIRTYTYISTYIPSTYTLTLCYIHISCIMHTYIYIYYII